MLAGGNTPMTTSMKLFMSLIGAMGVLRFVLTIAGLPNSMVKFASMTAIMIAGTFYFAVVTATHKDRLKAAYLLVVPYMVIEVAALGYTWATGYQTIFHAQEYSLGYGIALHTIGHLVGGLSWEPLFIFGIMEIVWFLYSRGRRVVHANS